MSHYISNTEPERAAMLEAIGAEAVDDLFQVVSSEVRFPELDLPEPLSEAELMRELRRMSGRNAASASLKRTSRRRSCLRRARA